MRFRVKAIICYLFLALLLLACDEASSEEAAAAEETMSDAEAFQSLTHTVRIEYCKFW